MDAKFHRTAVEIAFNAMPAGFREKFLRGFSIELLLDYADVPYVPQQFGEPEDLHLGHSYKLMLKGRDLHHVGETNLVQEIMNFAKSIEELSRKDETATLVRYNIAKSTHYIIDIATYSHVAESDWDKYHAKFEDLAADWLVLQRNIIESLVSNYTPVPMRSVQNRVRSIAKEAYFDSMEMLPSFKRNGIVTDLLWATMCCKHVYALMDWFSTFEKYL